MSVKTIKYIQPVTGTSSGNPTIIKGSTQVAGQSSVLIADMTVHQLLSEILTELKKLNLRQQEAFEETVKDEDVL